MDPLATLLRLQMAVDAKGWVDAIGALNDYYQWRVKGGAEPRWGSTFKGDTYADKWANKLMDRMEAQS